MSEVYRARDTKLNRDVALEKGAYRAWWTRDGRGLMFLASDLRALWRVAIQPGDSLGVGTPRHIATLPPDLIQIDATPDRQRFLAISPERIGTGSLTIVQNWRDALERR